MKDIFETWNKGEDDSELFERLLMQQAYKLQKSVSITARLKRNLIAGLIWALFITVGYVSLFFYVSELLVKLCLIIMIAFNGFVSLETLKLFKLLDATKPESQNLKAIIKSQIAAFKSWWRFQERLSFGVYPVGVAGGFMFGGTIGSGKSLQEFMSEPLILLALLIVTIVLVPLSYLMAKWMYNKAYGNYVNQLQEMLDDLEKE